MAEESLSLDNELVSDEELSGLVAGEQLEEPSGEEAPAETEEQPSEELSAEGQEVQSQEKDPLAKFRNSDGTINEDLLSKSYLEVEARDRRRDSELNNIRKALLTQGTTLAGRQVDPNASPNQQTTYQQPPGQVNGQQQVPSFMNGNNQQSQAEDLSSFLSDDMMLGESDLKAFSRLINHNIEKREQERQNQVLQVQERARNAIKQTADLAFQDMASDDPSIVNRFNDIFQEIQQDQEMQQAIETAALNGQVISYEDVKNALIAVDNRVKDRKKNELMQIAKDMQLPIDSLQTRKAANVSAGGGKAPVAKNGNVKNTQNLDPFLLEALGDYGIDLNNVEG